MTSQEALDLGPDAKPWCGHTGQYVVTMHLCGRPHSDTVVKCLTEDCGREYLGSELSARLEAVKARRADPDAEWCKHDMLPASCSECRPRKPRAPKRAGTFTARYDGECASCDGSIRAGDQIRKAPGRFGYLCPDCLED